MIFLALAFATLIGALFILLICRNSVNLNPLLFVSLSLGLGLASLSILTFFVFLCVGFYHPKIILGSSFLLLIILALINASYIRQHWPIEIAKLKENFKKQSSLSFLIIPIGVLFILGFQIAQQHPYGQWDAWAIWNMKFRFLVLSDNWRIIFNQLHPYTQPEYPLMLPMMNVWFSAFVGEKLNLIPQWSALSFYFLTPVLLISGLSHFIRREIALLTGFILILNPFYGLMATSQYADVILSFYLTASLISIFIFLEKPQKRTALLVGLFLGFLIFIKTEGTILCILLSTLLTLHTIFFQKEKLTCVLPIFIGIIMTAIPIGILKIMLTLPNKDIYYLLHTKNFNMQTLQTIFHHLWTEITEVHWAGLWFFIIFLLLFGIKRLFKKENLFLTMFFISYAFCLLVIYLTMNPIDLTWPLKSTLPRILFYLLPSVLFSLSLIHWRKKNFS